jgi:hypothetical protein
VFAKAVLTGVPLLALAAWFALKGGAFMDPILSLPAVYKVLSLGIAGLVLAISLSASVHLVVKAFSYGRFAQDDLPQPGAPAKKA